MDISQITDCLFIGSEPKAMQAAELNHRNVQLIISMIGGRRPLEGLARPPYQLLWLRTFDTTWTPIPMTSLIQGAQAALAVYQNGGSAFVFCAQGRHRSVVMGAAILIALGYPAQEAMALIQAQRPAADLQAPHVQWQILRFQTYWASQTSSGLNQLYEVYATTLAAVLSWVVLGLDQGPLRKYL